MVECSCTNKRNNKSMCTLIFGRMIVQKERINESESYIFVKWSCTKKITNEREPYIFVEWLCANQRNKSAGT